MSDDDYPMSRAIDVNVTSLSFNGTRRVEFPTFGTIFGGLSNRANVQVTPLLTPTGYFHEDNSQGKGICNFTLDVFRPGALTLQCFKGNGSGQHSRDALVLVVQPNDDELDEIAFAYLDSPTSSQYTVSTNRSFGRGTMRVERSGVGQYRVHWAR